MDSDANSIGITVWIEALLRYLRSLNLVRVVIKYIREPFLEYGAMVRGSPLKSLAAIIAFAMVVDEYALRIERWTQKHIGPGIKVDIWPTDVINVSSSVNPSCVAGSRDSNCLLLRRPPSKDASLCAAGHHTPGWYPIWDATSNVSKPGSQFVTVGFDSAILASEVIIHQTTNFSYIQSVRITEASTSLEEFFHLYDEYVRRADGSLVFLQAARYERATGSCVGILALNHPVLTREISIHLKVEGGPSMGIAAVSLRGYVVAEQGIQGVWLVVFRARHPCNLDGHNFKLMLRPYGTACRGRVFKLRQRSWRTSFASFCRHSHFQCRPIALIGQTRRVSG